MKRDFDEIVERTGTSCVKWDHYEMKDEVPDMIPMSIADMDFRCPEAVIEALHRRVSHGIFGYTVVPQGYYDAVSRWYSKRFNWKVESGWIRFSPGVIPALNLAVQAFTEPGDRVVIQPPVYHPFRYSIANNGRAVLNNPLIRKEDGSYVMDIEGLKSSIDGRTKMLILSNPHNPVGRVWRAGELKELVEVCIENGIIIISDEIHSDLIMPGFTHTPTASLSDEAARITVTCTSPSKTFNMAELHVANIIAPDYGLFSRLDAAFMKAGINKPNVLGMVACEAALEKGEAWLDELIRYVRGNYLLLKDYVGRNLPGVEVSEMEGTYLGWLDLRSKGPHEEVEERLLREARVAMTPGRIFGSGGEGFFRMNLACPRDLVEEALRRIESVRF